MPANTTPIFPLTPYFCAANLVAASACTSRGPTATASMASTPVFGVALGAAAGSNGRRIDKIQVNSCATAIGGATSAGLVIIWYDDGTTAYPIDEIVIPANTPSATAAGISVSSTYTNLVLASGHKLWASTTIAGAAAAHALSVYAFGGDY